MTILLVTLEIDVTDMTEEQLRDAGWFELMEDEDTEEAESFPGPASAEYEAHEIAGLLPGAIGHPDAELFAGSGVFVNLGEVRVTSARWSTTGYAQEGIGLQPL